MDFLNFTLEGCPATFIVAMQRTPDGKAEMAGAGRGLTQERAIAGCIGETLERAAGARQEGLRVIEADAPDLPRAHCLPNQVWCLSDRQLAQGPHASEDVSAKSWQATLEVHANCRRWISGRTAVSAQPVFIPLANALIGGEGTLNDSNGLAAGRTLREAETSAVLELVERDAVAIWWYGRCLRPPVALDVLDASGGSALREWLQARERRTWLLDLTHDLGTPVIAAVSCGPDGHDIAYGFAARCAVSEAALSASLEMLQTELSLKLARSAAAKGVGDGHGARLLNWSKRTGIADFPFLVPHAEAAAVAPSLAPGDLAPGDPAPGALVAQIGARIGTEVAFIDLHRPDDDVFVVRAVAPGLRPWWPRFAPGRLETVPSRLGWETAPIDEAAVGEQVILI